MLKPSDGEIAVAGGRRGDAVSIRVWVDANHPLIHIETHSAENETETVRFESLRPVPENDIQADTILAGRKDRVAWFYRNRNKSVSRLANLTFGGVMQGSGLVSVDDTTLKSSRPARSEVVSIHVLTAQTPTPVQWLAELEEQVRATDAVDLATARRQHQAWWREFWGRSWIVADGDGDARKVTQGYALQRFVTACAAAAGPTLIKFNGSIFTMDGSNGKKSRVRSRNTDERATLATGADSTGSRTRGRCTGRCWPAATLR